MDFAFSDEQKLLVTTIRRFIAENLQPLEEEVEQTGELPRKTALELQARARELGLYAINMPSEYGGGGLSNLDRMLCEEQFGRTTDILVRRAFGNVYEPLLHCQAGQIDRWLKPTVAGARTCSIAITEPGAGSDAASVKTRAVRSDRGWVLNGAKHFISDGQWSDFFLVSAQTGEREISMFMVDKGLPGFSLGKDQKMMGLRGTSHMELFFHEVPLEDAALLGERGQGFKLAMRALNVVRLAQVGARAVGKASLVCEKMIAWAREREQFGRPIGDFQMIQQMIADSVLDINSARSMVYQAAWLLDRGAKPGIRSRWSRSTQRRLWVGWSIAPYRFSEDWVFAPICRLNGITATPASTGSSTERVRSIAASSREAPSPATRACSTRGPDQCGRCGACHSSAPRKRQARFATATPSL